MALARGAVGLLLPLLLSAAAAAPPTQYSFSADTLNVAEDVVTEAFVAADTVAGHGLIVTRGYVLAVRARCGARTADRARAVPMGTTTPCSFGTTCPLCST